MYKQTAGSKIAEDNKPKASGIRNGEIQARCGERPPTITVVVDGRKIENMEGDSVLTAIMLSVGHVRQSDFGDGERAPFCMMGACQDYWVSTENGNCLRACSTPVLPGLRLVTKFPNADYRVQA